MCAQNFFVVTIASLFSILGTIVGASFASLIKEPSNKMIGIVNSFAAGLMFSIVIFDLVPEAMTKLNFITSVNYFVFGIVIIFFIELFSDKSKVLNDISKKAAFMASLGLMIHNFPEGMVMGAGFLASGELGVEMSLLIAIHDIPEGVAIAAPFIASRIKTSKIILYAFLTALPTVIGAWIGVAIGDVSVNLLGEFLSIASGIMFYVIFEDMMPQALELCKWIRAIEGFLLGTILGLVIINIL
ncbi:ZIP family metal transporter [Clostridium aestuarii]|uniref:ZIP family metal transporter n=1 Tax=Clostridium aestuarii TaxID=338193 RepID=A0ABT4D2Z6_9CLOT|nr:ZIP family metal transporter [Clostridium aestuarii]MCY6485613.1 ZIP family metal transporter [Clostridium aestuarii]